MKNILFTIETLNGGGAERVLINLLQKLDRNKFQLNLLLFSKEGVYLKQLPDDVKVFYLFRDPLTFKFSFFRFLYRAFRWFAVKFLVSCPSFLRFIVCIKGNYDVGISFCEGINLALLVYNRTHFKRLISWVHIDFSKHTANISNSKIAILLKSFDSIFFVSEDARLGFFKKFPKVASIAKTKVVYNPINIASIKSMDNSEPFHKERITVLSVGRLSRQKRFDKLIRVQRMLIDQGVFCDMLIIGEGPEAPVLKALIHEFNLMDNVKLEGFKENSYEWIRHADILAMTSDYEGLPLVICEGMVLAKPILATNVTGPRELLEDGKFGLLVDNTDLAIYEGLKELITNRASRNHYTKILEDNQGNFIFTDSLSHIETLLNSD